MHSGTLKEIFADAAEKYGVDVRSVEFSPFRDMKCRWVRVGRTIEFVVTDYMKEAPEGIVRDLADTLMAKIYGDSDKEYSDDFSEWVTGDEFVRLNRDTYLERCGALPDNYRCDRDLRRTYEDLVAKGLVGEIPGLDLRWTEGDGIDPLGMSSMLMRSVVMPTKLDGDGLPEDVFEFNLFRLLTNVDTDFGIDPMERRILEKVRLASYPDGKRLLRAVEDYRDLAEGGAN